MSSHLSLAVCPARQYGGWPHHSLQNNGNDALSGLIFTIFLFIDLFFLEANCGSCHCYPFLCDNFLDNLAMGSNSQPAPNGHTLDEVFVNGVSQPASINDASTPAFSEMNGAGKISRDVAPIAIIGMACHSSGNVSSAEGLWELCSRARSGWSPVPKERWSQEGYFHPNAARTGTYNPEGAYFIQKDLALFDAPFFNISALEAKSIDPQQRLLLECTYEALENAGVPKESIIGQSVGVFVGGSFSEYSLFCLRDPDRVPAYEATGTAQSVLANRLSYYFDLKGPSVTVDTACSSGLSALHLACQSLRSGECSQASVGASHLNVMPDMFISMSNSRYCPLHYISLTRTYI